MSHLTTKWENGALTIKWRGERIGSFQYVSGGIVSGVAIYREAVFSTDDYSECGIPWHWIPEKLTLLCQLQDSLNATGHAA